MTSKSRGHCDNIKVFNQGKSNQIREKSGNLIAKNVWPPCYGYASFQGADFFYIRTVYDLINFKGVQGYIHRSIPF